MNLWKTREEALARLATDLLDEAQVLDGAFALLDECVSRFEEKGIEVYMRVCGLTLLKGRHLAMACYSLTLDGLAQEAGAVLRPMIEIIEQLKYYEQEPQRTEKAVSGTMPKAGDIAKKIDGDWRFMRDHLNDNASHFNFSSDAVRHLVDSRNFNWKTEQSFNKDVLRTNMGMLFTFMLVLIRQGIHSFCFVGGPWAQIANHYDEWRDNGILVFNDLECVVEQAEA